MSRLQSGEDNLEAYTVGVYDLFNILYIVDETVYYIYRSHAAHNIQL